MAAYVKVANADDLQPGDRIVTTLAKGHVTSRVESTEDQKTH